MSGGSGRSRAEDLAKVTAALGRTPAAEFDVVVRNLAGAPAVIVNAPFLDDATPMPTRYWLVDPELCIAVARLEAAGGIREVEQEVDAEALRSAHERYAIERNAAVPACWRGPCPVGGVGGTRTGVKCLHAHLAWWLAGGDDPVGRWTARHLGLARDQPAAGLFTRRAPRDSPLDLDRRPHLEHGRDEPAGGWNAGAVS